jgi:hypothetical protein
METPIFEEITAIYCLNLAKDIYPVVKNYKPQARLIYTKEHLNRP